MLSKQANDRNTNSKLMLKSIFPIFYEICKTI
jgi:hypothetical protein